MIGSKAKAAGLLFLVVFLVLESQLFDSPDAEVFGVSVPVWAIALASYVLGVLAGWAAERSRSSAG